MNKYIPSLQNHLDSMNKVLNDIRWIVILLFTLMIIFALITIQYCDNIDRKKSNHVNTKSDEKVTWILGTITFIIATIALTFCVANNDKRNNILDEIKLVEKINTDKKTIKIKNITYRNDLIKNNKKK